ncbi:hypothetical protein EDB83DRAFT_2321429 [Lactarius deliciosus]|nr:hypothetical protein EDB83DRAFT_2321429 [Lactarius deliciosus]
MVSLWCLVCLQFCVPTKFTLNSAFEYYHDTSALFLFKFLLFVDNGQAGFTVLHTGSIRVGAALPVHFENYKTVTVFAGSRAQAQPPLYPRREHLSWCHAGFENYKTATVFACSMALGCTALCALAGSTGVGEDSEVGTDTLPMMRGIYVLGPMYLFTKHKISSLRGLSKA